MVGLSLTGLRTTVTFVSPLTPSGSTTVSLSTFVPNMFGFVASVTTSCPVLFSPLALTMVSLDMNHLSSLSGCSSSDTSGPRSMVQDAESSSLTCTGTGESNCGALTGAVIVMSLVARIPRRGDVQPPVGPRLSPRSASPSPPRTCPGSRCRPPRSTRTRRRG